MKTLINIGGAVAFLWWLLAQKKDSEIVPDVPVKPEILISDQMDEEPVVVSRPPQNSDFSPTLTTYVATDEEKYLYALSNR
ncbi:hypothetical protein [Kaistella sp.]|uniref:hypothetical protein n=1 Tax=Kaistella sp. TaxID=2782235 RepID=UPI003C5CB283